MKKILGSWTKVQIPCKNGEPRTCVLSYCPPKTSHGEEKFTDGKKRKEERGREKKKLEIWPHRPMYFAAAVRQFPWGVVHHWGWHFPWGVAHPWGRVDFGPYLPGSSWPVGGGWHPRAVHLNQRSRCSRNHWSSNTTSHLFQTQRSNKEGKNERNGSFKHRRILKN